VTRSGICAATVLATLFLAVPPAALATSAAPDQHEPNNSPREARGPLNEGEAYFGHFNGNEADWFWFGVTGGSQDVRIEIENQSNPETQCPVIHVTLVGPHGETSLHQVALGETIHIDMRSTVPDDEYTLGFSMNGCQDTLWFPAYEFTIESDRQLRAEAEPCGDLRHDLLVEQARLAWLQRRLHAQRVPARRRKTRARISRQRRAVARARGRLEGCRAAHDDGTDAATPEA
jgi:hypothetical protein